MLRNIDLCAPGAMGIAEWAGEQNVLCHNSTFASKWFWVMITSAACASRSLLIKKLLHTRDQEELFFSQWCYKFRECCLDRVCRSDVCRPHSEREPSRWFCVVVAFVLHCLVHEILFVHLNHMSVFMCPREKMSTLTQNLDVNVKTVFPVVICGFKHNLVTLVTGVMIT